jgi:hypothetical protein
MFGVSWATFLVEFKNEERRDIEVEREKGRRKD